MKQMTDEKDEQLGWKRFYRTKCAQEFEDNDTPRNSQRKVIIEEKLKAKWSALGAFMKKSYIKKAKEIRAARHQKSVDSRMKIIKDEMPVNPVT